jgi:hypothetical protein
MTFLITERNVQVLERHLSLERLSRYAAIAPDNRLDALRHYERNTRLSEALYTPLQGLEVCLRNALSLELAATLGASWHDNAHGMFQHPLTEMIEQAKLSLDRESKTVTLGRMVAELNFGFWVSLLAPRYENNLWRPSLRKAFAHRPRGTERKDVLKAVNALRRLRNRVAHHEPILQRNLKEDHELILRIIGWTCPETAMWIGGQSRFLEVFEEA